MATASSQSSNPSQPNLRQALITLRIIWGVLLSGLLIFGAIVTSPVIQGQKGGVDDTAPTTIIVVAAVYLLVAAFVGFIMRRLIFKRGKKNGVVPPGIYATGNIILWASLESSAFSSVALMLVADTYLLGVIALAAILLFILSFPTGRPMLPRDAAFAPAETL